MQRQLCKISTCVNFCMGCVNTDNVTTNRLVNSAFAFTCRDFTDGGQRGRVFSGGDHQTEEGC